MASDGYRGRGSTRQGKPFTVFSFLPDGAEAAGQPAVGWLAFETRRGGKIIPRFIKAGASGRGRVAVLGHFFPLCTLGGVGCLGCAAAHRGAIERHALDTLPHNFGAL